MTSPDLIYAILSMASYDEGYLPGLNLLPGKQGVGSKIGDAIVLTDSSDALKLPPTFATGFYAAAFKYQGQTVIAYRGTDNNIPSLNNPSGSDAYYGYSIFLGNYLTAQAEEAAEFYLAVRQGAPASNIVLTGHSLGGGLAGFVGGVYGSPASVFDNMPFEAGVASFELDYATGLTPSLFASNLASPDPSLFNQNINGAYVDGNFLPQLSFPFFGPLLANPPLTALESYSGVGTFGALGSFTQLHSIALLIDLLYASSQSSPLTDWQSIGKPLWTAYFNEAIGDALGGRDKLANGGSDSAAQAMDAMIAYSATPGGSPFGSASIQSLFADADLLGKFVTQKKTGALLSGDATLSALSEIIIQNAGDQAAWAGAHQGDQGGQDYAGATGAFSASTDTVLKINTDHSGGTGQTAWQQTSGSETNKIVGVEDLVTAVEQSNPIFYALLNAPSAFSNTLKSKIAAFADKATVVEALLSSTGAIDDPAATALGQDAILIGGDGTGTIKSGDADTLVFGGKDITVGNGNDTVVAASGDVKIHLGLGSDTVLGGMGDDTLFYDTPGTSGDHIVIDPALTQTGDVIVNKSGTDANHPSKDELVNVKHIVLSQLSDTFTSQSTKLANISIDAGTGDDTINVTAGTNITTAGGLGRDKINNQSAGGVIWGDVADSVLDVTTDRRYTLATTTNPDGATSTTKQWIADDASNSDDFSWAPDTTIEDPQKHDIINFYGIPLVGGADNGGIVQALGVGGLLGSTIASAQAFTNPLDTLYVDQLLPFITRRPSMECFARY